MHSNIDPNFWLSLSDILTDKEIIIDDIKKTPYETDWRNRYCNKAIACVFPTNNAQIQQIVQLCAKYNIYIVPQGGNTSLCGNATPTKKNLPQIILNFSKLNKILAIDIENQCITVEAGCTLESINKALLNYNLFFPLTIASEGSCQIGGNIATNAGGVHVVKYGTIRELVLGIEAILPSGDIVNQLYSLRKNNLNFDLKQIFIGSEGTLGIITKASLKLFPKPYDHIACLIGLKDIPHSLKLLRELQRNFNVSVFEILNATTQEIYHKHFPNNPIPIHANWLVFFEIELFTEINHDILSDILQNFQLNDGDIILASNHKERQKLWFIRENIPLAEKMHGFAIKHDISLPISQIANFITTNQENLDKLNISNAKTVIFGHLGDGNLHYNIQFNHRDIKQIQLYEYLVNLIVYKDINSHGGSISAEHGIGQLKKEWFKKYYDQSSYQLIKSFKTMIDPHNLFNPDKIFNF